MVVCKFFLQGNCRFGENCKFEHQVYDTRQTSGSILRQQNAPVNPSNVDVNVLVRSVANDMLGAEKGGQWLLSSYAPFKDKPPFPGFEDKSFEEVRLGYYEAQRNGTVEQYKQQLQMALQEAMMRIKMLQNPSAEIVNVLKNIYNTPISSTNTLNTAFPVNASSFGSNTNTNASSFGSNTNTNASSFGSNTNTFASQQSPASTFSFSQASKSIFGQTNATTSSVFGGGNQGIFGGQQQQQVSPFASNQQNIGYTTQTAQQQSPNVFGGNNQSIFGSQLQNPTAFNTQQEYARSPMFANQPQQTTSSVFAPPQQTSASFANQPLNFPTQQPAVAQVPFPAQSIFANADSSVFSQSSPATPPNTFGNNSLFADAQRSSSSTHTSNIFGSVHSGGFSTTGQPVDETAYSKLEDLNENEVKAFENDVFEFGQIPEKPPTMQMCF